MLIQHYLLSNLSILFKFQMLPVFTYVLSRGKKIFFSPVQDRMLSYYISRVIWNDTLVIFCFVLLLP